MPAAAPTDLAGGYRDRKPRHAGPGPFNEETYRIPSRRIGAVRLANRNYPIPARVEAGYRMLEELAASPRPLDERSQAQAPGQPAAFGEADEHADPAQFAALHAQGPCRAGPLRAYIPQPRTCRGLHHFKKHLSMTTPLRTRLLPSLIAAGFLVAAAATSSAAPHPKHHPAARKAAVATEPAMTTDANGLSVPVLPNKAWVLMDFNTGQILASSNADEPLPPASLTKMMTSYLVEQGLKSGRLKPNESVVMSLNAWCRGGKNGDSCMFVPLNAQASLMDMLRGVVVDSGNDASKALAEHIGGSESGFAAMMNAEAARLGMTHTHFENSTGLPDPNHKASARDLAVLAQAIIRNSGEYYPIYAEHEFTYNGIKQGNRNALLYTDPTVDGLKTGHTEEAGYCLTASAKRNGMRLIAVVMNADSVQARADQVRVLFNWGYSNFEEATPAQAGATLATAKVLYGVAPTVPAGVAQAWTVVVPKGQSAAVKTSVSLNPDLTAPIAKGAVIGKIVATAGGKQLGEAPLVALAGVERAGFFQRIMQRITGMFSK